MKKFIEKLFGKQEECIEPRYLTDEAITMYLGGGEVFPVFKIKGRIYNPNHLLWVSQGEAGADQTDGFRHLYYVEYELITGKHLTETFATQEERDRVYWNTVNAMYGKGEYTV